jgi:hypothetical protein
VLGAATPRPSAAVTAPMAAQAAAALPAVLAVPAIRIIQAPPEVPECSASAPPVVTAAPVVPAFHRATMAPQVRTAPTERDGGLAAVN